MAVSHPSENEESPLLPPLSPSPPKKHPHVFRVLFLCVLSIFLIEIGDFMQRAPWTRILEDIVCREHFSTHARRWEPEIPEQDCKVAPVQARVAMLKGWDLSFSCMPAIFLAVPYGALADRVGRKSVLLLALLGVVLGNWWTMAVGELCF
jgi:MFS family permease